MKTAFVRVCQFAAGTILGATLLVGCAGGPRPSVDDFDSYQIVQIGKLRYITPDGIRASDKRRGLVQHDILNHPDVFVKVAFDSNPPRSLRFDADAEKRRFLDQVPNGELTSVQYGEYEGRQHIKIMVRGRQRDGRLVHGNLLLLREGGNTATVRLIGPWEKRDAMNGYIESFSRTMEFTNGQ
jgi:hypothetical protein